MLSINDSGLEFPLPFALKIIGKDETGFVEHAVSIVREYAPDIDEQTVTTRASSAKTYISVNVPFTAESREQLNAIYRDLTASERILMII